MYTRKNFKKNALRFLMLFTITFLVLFMSTERLVYASESTDVLGTLSSESVIVIALVVPTRIFLIR